MLRTSGCGCRTTGRPRPPGAAVSEWMVPFHTERAFLTVHLPEVYEVYSCSMRPKNCVLTSIPSRAHIVIADPIICTGSRSSKREEPTIKEEVHNQFIRWAAPGFLIGPAANLDALNTYLLGIGAAAIEPLVAPIRRHVVPRCWRPPFIFRE